jgi:hypothetical protein
MAGYALKKGNTWLSLFPEQSIIVSKETGLFADTVLPGMVSFPTSLPVTKINVQAFGNIHNLAVFNYPEKITGIHFYLEGSLTAIGSLIINNVSPDAFDVTFTEWDNLGEIDKIMLQDIAWPVYDVTTSNADVVSLPTFHQMLVDRAINGANEDGIKDFVAPTVYNPAAVPTTQWEWFHNWSGHAPYLVSMPFQNNWHNDSYAIPLGTTGGGAFYAYLPNVVSLFTYANWVMEKAWSHLGFKIAYSKLKEGELDNLLIYSNRAISLFNMDQFVGSGNGLYSPRKIRFYESSFDVKEFLPNVSLLKFLEAFQKTFNLQFIVNHERSLVRIECRNDKIVNPNVVDISQYANKYTSWNNQNEAKYSGLKYERQREADTPKYIYKGDLPAVGSLPVSGNAASDMYFVVDEYSGYAWDAIQQIWEKVFTNETDGIVDLHTINDSAISLAADVADNNTRHLIEQKHGNYNTQLGTFSKTVQTGTVNRPLTTKKAIFDLYAQDNTSPEMIFLFYRGILPGVFDMPVATSEAEIRDPSDAVMAEFDSSLEMFGEKGIYNRFHKAWMQFTKTSRPVTMQLDIPIYTLSKVMNNIVRIDGQQYLIAKATITATPNAVKSVKTELLQQKPGM